MSASGPVEARGAGAITLLAIVLAFVSAGATLERTHWLTTHADTGLNSLITTSSPAPAEKSIYPSGTPDELLGSNAAGADGGDSGGVSLSQSPQDPGAADFHSSVVVAQVHALTAIAAVQACVARHGAGADCSEPTAGSLGTTTDLTIVHRAPAVGEVRVIHQGVVYSATAAAARGIWYAVTLNAQTQAQSRTCFSHHGRQSCQDPTW